MADKPQNLFSLESRVAIVTGGSRGIGAKIADTFAEAGADVIGLGRSEEPDAIPAKGVSYRKCDILDTDAFRTVCDQITEDYGRLDILVNNAGIFIPISGPENRLDAFDSQIRTNLRAAYACGIVASDKMIQAGNGGTIINDTEYLSKANQALIFNNQIEHQGFTQTDTPIRIVLNIVTSND